MKKFMNNNLMNPNLFLFFAIISSAFVLIFGGIYSYNLQDDLLKNSEHSKIISARVENIRFFDEILTGSTLLAASTGNAQWEMRYHLYAPKLDSAINELLHIDPLHAINRTLKMTDSANIQLEALEHKVFELVHLGKRNEAFEILTSSEYARQKALYSDGLSSFIKLHNQNNDLLLMRLRKKGIQSKWFFSLAILLLAIVWIPIEHFLRKSRAQMLKQNQELELQILARKESETALLESQKLIERTHEQLQESIQASSVGLWEWNIQTNEVYQSPKFKQQIGYEDDEVQSSTEFYFSHLHPEDVQTVNESSQLLISGETEKLNLEYRFRHKDGSYLWMLARTSLQRDQFGNPIRMFGSHIDITERKLAEAEVKESETKFKTLFEFANDAIFIMDDKYFIDCNFKTEQIFGCSRIDIIGYSPVKFSPEQQPDGRLSADKAVENINAALKGEHQFFEWTHCRLDGTLFEVEVGLSRINLGGKFYLQAIVRDISERKKAEDKLKESEEKYRILAETSPEMIYLIDTKGYVTYVNKVAAEQFRAPAQELIGKHLKNIFPPYLAQQNFAGIQKVITTKSKSQSEVEMIFPTGNRWIDARLTPVFDEKNQVVGVLGLSYDITERKQADAEIKKINKELTKLNAEKDKFFSIIAHDLKTPFNSIIGFSEILVEQVKEKNYQGIEQYTGIILQSSQRAMDLLMNLMEWSRSQTGKMEFNPAYFQMIELINEVELLLDDAAGQKSIVITNTLPDNIAVYADKNMMSAVLRNLISNAIKFTHPGGEIIISVEEKDELTVSVSDNGIGIPKERIEQLFRIDENYSTSGTLNEKGTGLGLILCKEFIEKHGGKIWVESEEGKGSIFYFTLPYNSRHQTANKAINPKL